MEPALIEVGASCLAFAVAIFMVLLATRARQCLLNQVVAFQFREEIVTLMHILIHDPDSPIALRYFSLDMETKLFDWKFFRRVKRLKIKIKPISHISIKSDLISHFGNYYGTIGNQIIHNMALVIFLSGWRNGVHFRKLMKYKEFKIADLNESVINDVEVNLHNEAVSLAISTDMLYRTT